MLSPELSLAHRRGDALGVTPLRGARRDRALELAAAVLDVLGRARDETRDEIEAAMELLGEEAREQKLRLGLAKLALDACRFHEPERAGAEAWRRDVFLRASAARTRGEFDRGRVLAEAAAALGVTPAELEAGLFADLRGRQRLLEPTRETPEVLLARWERARVQAVLLRAVRVVVTVRCASPAAYRELFRRVKFRRLLHRIERGADGYRIEIDGPSSLFRASTRYGLELALLLPALEGCESASLEAEVAWGPRRAPLTFHWAHEPAGGAADAPGAQRPLDDELSSLAEGVARHAGWKAEPADVLVEAPGVGVLVPDLRVESPEGAAVWVERLGYWSREAVFRRVDAVRGGLSGRWLFLVAKRLRVSEEVLAEEPGAGLLVAPELPSARAVVRACEELLLRGAATARAGRGRKR